MVIEWFPLALRSLRKVSHANQGRSQRTPGSNRSSNFAAEVHPLESRLLLTAPTITSDGAGPSASIHIFENTTAVTTVSAFDPDSGDTLTYSLAGGADSAKFSIDPTSGALTFLTAPNFESSTDSGRNNVYDVNVKVSDGTLTDTQAIAVTIDDLNDAPNGVEKTVTINEDTPYTFGLLDFGYSDSDSPPDNLVSITVTQPNRGSLLYNNVAITSTTTIPVADIVGGKLVFAPAANAWTVGYALFRFQLKDDGGTDNGGKDTSDQLRIAVDVLKVADTPSVTNASTLEDTQSTNGLVITRNPADGLEIAWYKITNITNGTLYKHDGVTAIANGTFLPYADAEAGLKFTPNANLNSLSNTFSFQAQASFSGVKDTGLGGDVITATITVTSVNDAPLLSATGTPSLTSIAQNTPASSNSGTPVSQIISNLISSGGGITDADSAPLQGIAITSVDQSHGTWQYTTNNGANWFSLGAATASASRLLAPVAGTRIRFLPDANFSGSANFLFVAWDQTAGTNGGTAIATNRGGSKPFSSATRYASIAITPAPNSAPVLDPGGNPTLTAIPQNVPNAANPGTLVSEIITNLTITGGSITDPDAGAAQGIAVTKVDNTNGVWQFSTNNGTSWSDFGDPSAATARLLASAAGTRIRFIPASGFIGSASILFVAWDQSSGTNGGVDVATLRGGIKPYSLGYDSATIAVHPNNAAPVLVAKGNPALPDVNSILPASTNAGMLISDFIAGMGPQGSITDADAGAVQGIAITSTDQAHGTWQFSLDNGAGWTDVGIPSAAAARLLASTPGTKIRFVPAPGYVGSASLIFVAWDQTTGTNGSTASATNRGTSTSYSTGYDICNINVFSSNHAPVLDPAHTPTFPTVDAGVNNALNQGLLIFELIAAMGPNRITDSDAGDPQGIAVFSADQANGTWQCSLDNGTNWSPVGTVTDSVARLLASDTQTRLRFVPNATYNGTATIQFYAWDQTSGTNGETGNASTRGGTSSFSTESETAPITSQFVNHAPTLDDAGNPKFNTIQDDIGDALNTGLLVTELITSMGSNRITDLDSGALRGIAITAKTDSNGAWQYSLNNGSTWTDTPAVSDSSALLLAANSQTRIRFAPLTPRSSNYSRTITFRAWDQTSGTNGSLANTTTNGGNTAFSTATESASITVQPS